MTRILTFTLLFLASLLGMGPTPARAQSAVHGGRGTDFTPGPSLTLDKRSLQFAVVPASLRFVPVPVLVGTGDQVVRLTQIGVGTVTWTATSSHPWIVVTPASGTGSATLSIGIQRDPFPWNVASGVGTITFTVSGSLNIPRPIEVSVTVSPSPVATIGAVDTPLENSTDVVGSVPFTGWALDTFEVTGVSICRDAVPGETPVIDARCGGAAQLYVGDATFIDGARPDVMDSYPTYPRSSRAGWGFMMLTNMLPNQGNGTYVFSAYAFGVPTSAPFGPWIPRVTLLGTRTMTCANASATKPFGAIDTPTQGGTASGPNFINFGWALTPQPKVIPIDGSTITALVDGTPLGTVDYNHERADIEAQFPGFTNTAGTNGAIGFRVINTQNLFNGLHTISWTVVDDQGSIEGIGSRFFTVVNGVGLETAAQGAASSRWAAATSDVMAAQHDSAPVLGRRGWDLTGPWRSYAVGRSGRAVIRGEELDRFELLLGALGGAHYTGHLRTSEGLAALPVGSQLDASTGAFTWAPGVGFVGTYDLMFVRWEGNRPAAQQNVRIILAPKGSGSSVGPHVVIDAPTSQQDVTQPFVLGGWAADLSATTGTGIATLHAWAYPMAGGAPVFLGATAYGGVRPDVEAVYGDQYSESGFGLVVQGLARGDYDLAVFAWSTERADFVPAKVVRVAVR